MRYLDSYLHSYTGFPVAHSQNQTPPLFLIWASRRTWQLSLTIDRKILILRLHCLIYIGHGQYNSVMCVIYSFGIRILYKIHYFVVYARVKRYRECHGTVLWWYGFHSNTALYYSFHGCTSQNTISEPHDTHRKIKNIVSVPRTEANQSEYSTMISCHQPETDSM